jgi:sulfur carrier protein ThiS
MANSETSSDIKVNYQNSRGENLLEDQSKKPQSTDTDYYFNMIANPTKVTNKEKSVESESSLHDLLKNTESDKSSTSTSSNSSKSSESRPSYDKIPIAKRGSPKPPQIPSYKPSGDNVPEVIGATASGTAAVMVSTADVKPLTPQEIRLKKIELIRKLCEIKSKGFTLTKEYDFNSSIEEMEYEYELLRSFADKRNGVKIFRNGILQAVSVIEFLNDKYDPFDFHLSGWGDHVTGEIDSWEDVLEELYEKYKGSGKKMAPEIKLLYLIVASAGAFHFTKSQASKMPGLDAVLAANPGLLSKIMNPKKNDESQFMTAQEVNIMKQKEEFKKKENDNKMKMQQQQTMMMQMQEQLKKQQDMLDKQTKVNSSQSVNDILNSRTFNSEPMAANSKPAPLPQSIPVNQLRPNIPDIRAPDQVKDILNRLHMKQSNNDTQDETSSQNDRLVSETTLSESNPKKKQQRKPKKGGISIF